MDVRKKFESEVDRYTRILNHELGWKVRLSVYLHYDPFGVLKLSAHKLSAGWVSHTSPNVVNINMKMYALSAIHAEHILTHTIPHEVAHCFAMKLPGGDDMCGHGANWRACMKLLGKPPNEFHTLQIPASWHYNN